MKDSLKPHAKASERERYKQEPTLRNDGVVSAGDWRQLAQLAQHETDPEKLSTLVEQLIAAFDREKSQKLSFRSSDEPHATAGLG